MSEYTDALSTYGNKTLGYAAKRALSRTTQLQNMYISGRPGVLTLNEVLENKRTSDADGTVLNELRIILDLLKNKQSNLGGYSELEEQELSEDILNVENTLAAVEIEYQGVYDEYKNNLDSSTLRIAGRSSNSLVDLLNTGRILPGGVSEWIAHTYVVNKLKDTPIILRRESDLMFVYEHRERMKVGKTVILQAADAVELACEEIEERRALLPEHEGREFRELVLSTQEKTDQLTDTDEIFLEALDNKGEILHLLLGKYIDSETVPFDTIRETAEVKSAEKEHVSYLYKVDALYGTGISQNSSHCGVKAVALIEAAYNITLNKEAGNSHYSLPSGNMVTNDAAMFSLLTAARETGANMNLGEAVAEELNTSLLELGINSVGRDEDGTIVRYDGKSYLEAVDEGLPAEWARDISVYPLED